jgi:steroid 5-alpha reductase family enzyme
MVAVLALVVLVLIAVLWMVQRRKARAGGVVAADGATDREARS